MREGVKSIGLDRVESFVFLGWMTALFLTSLGFWFGRALGTNPVYFGFGVAFLAAVTVSWEMALKFLSLCTLCWLLCAYSFTYCGIDASVCHVPMQRLLIGGWNPVFDGTLEKLNNLTNGDISLYHTLCMPKTVQMTGAMIAKATGLYVADTVVHYFLIYVVFAAAYRFARSQWNCSSFSAIIFGFFTAMPSQIGTMMGSAIDFPQYACMATAIMSICTWEKSRRPGDIFMAIACLSLAITIKPMGFFFGLFGLGFLAFHHRNKAQMPWIALLAMVFVIITASIPYIVIWVRYGSPFYPTHSFMSGMEIVNITEDFTANTDGESMGYLARIVYAWFSTKLACLGCALFQGKDAFNPEFYVPVGVDGLKAWFRLIMWFSVFALAFSKKDRVTLLCGLIFVLMNIAPLKYIGFGRYFMLMWMIPPLALFNLVYNPQCWLCGVVKYARFGAHALLFGLAIMIAAKTTMLYLRALGIEGARQVVFREAADKGLRFVPDRPMRGFGIKERLTHVEGLDYPEVDDIAQSTEFDSVLYFPHDLSITPRQINNDFPRVDTLRQFRQFRFDKMIVNLPKVLWEKNNVVNASPED